MILVVDDHQDTCMAIVQILRWEGYAAEGVHSGAKALDHLKSQLPSLILLDYMMPDMDGLTILAMIKGDTSTARVPVVMFSAYDGDLRQRAILAGAADCIQKSSLDIPKVLNLISRLIGPAKPRSASPTAQKPSSRDVC